MWGLAKKLSISVKISLGLIVVMLSIVLTDMFLIVHNENDLALQLIEQQTKDTADSYFDGVNTMMLTGMMANKEILRQKILARPGIAEARIIRHEKTLR